ncbi:MAG: hypothetical protein L3J89_00855 [Gammaproteobacteria bacterium]|nr:hypothetical protein [Gammaproteobacteria bacterium]
MLKKAFRGMLLVVAGTWCVVIPLGALADVHFQFGFVNEAENQDLTIDCNRASSDSRCAFGGNTGAYFDPTPFLQEVVYVDGVRYYHSIIGDPNSDFAQEVYIEASGCCYQASGNYDPFPRSASNSRGGLANGSGSGNPNRVVMRNMVRDEEMTQWFLKDTLLFKPLITQLVVNADVRMDFQIDMRMIDYGTIDTPGVVSNRLKLLKDNEGITGDYDNNIIPGFFSDKSQVKQTVSGGQYTYTDGPDQSGSGGVYTYWDGGGYQEYLADHNLFRRDDQNEGYQIRQ